MRLVVVVSGVCFAAGASEKLAQAPPAGVGFSGRWKLNEADSDDPQRLIQAQSNTPAAGQSSSGGGSGGRGGRPGGGGSGGSEDAAGQSVERRSALAGQAARDQAGRRCRGFHLGRHQPRLSAHGRGENSSTSRRRRGPR